MLTSPNNITPAKTLTREDITKVIRDELGQVRAEMETEARDKALRELDDPDFQNRRRSKAHGMAAAAWGEGSLGNVRRSRRDPLANKAIEEMDQHECARMFARWVQCTYQARQRGGGLDLAAEIAKAAGQMTLHKAFQATDFDQGGFLIEPAFSDAIIEELVPRVVYQRANPTPLELPEGGFSMPYEDDGADAQWVGEGVAPNAEEVTGGQLRMQPHKLITIVGMSNDMLRARPGTSDEFILRSILRGMGTTLDSTLIRGLGFSGEPMGLRGFVPSANTINATSITGLTHAVMVRLLIQLQNIIETNNIDMALDRPTYFTSPRLKNFLRAQRATDGVLFPSLDTGNMLLSVPMHVTSNIPINLDASGTSADDETEMYIAAMAQMLLGNTLDMQVDIDPGAAYVNSSGTLVSAFSRDETPIRVINKWDHQASQRGNEIAFMDQIDWALA